MKRGILSFNASVCVGGNDVRKVNREGLDGPLSGGECSGIFGCCGKGLISQWEKALWCSFELFGQLLGAKGLMGIPVRSKCERGGWCGAMEEEVCMMAEASQIIHGERKVDDLVEKELPKEFLIGDDAS